ncbi:MAG TPA: hypothetical protein VHX14_20935 [Thermoanaerobaculia bacterium]|jgi:hypothetical protein|nr:hypothetical protein [Thermoanaerobaculia bacterium]
MPSLEIITIGGVVVLAVLLWVYLRMRSKDRIDEILARHRSSASVCTRANLMEGMEMIPVALALKNDAIYYENSDLQASIELALIEEVEYDDETATGHTMPGKVLRIRAHNHVFEFALDLPTARQWEAALPPRRIDRAQAV